MASMTSAEGIARDYFEAFNRRDWDASLSLLHAEYSYTGRNGERRDSPNAGLANSQFYADRFPGLKLDIQRIHATREAAVVEYVAVLENESAQAAGVPWICAVLEMKDGKIHTEREYWQRSLPAASSDR